MRLTRSFVFVALCSALSACNCNPGGNDGGTGGGSGGAGGGSGGGSGGGAGGGGGGPPGLALNDFCQAAVDGMKDQFFREEAVCGTAITKADIDHILYQGFVTFADTYAGSDCNDGGLSQQMQRYRDAVNAGRLEYNPERALECQQVGRATKNDGGFPFKSFDGKLINPCAQVWTPKVAAGGACEADYECVGDNYCKPSNANSCGGTCVARLPLGSLCTPIRNECNNDGFCDTGDDGGYQCVAYLGAGDLCGATGQPDCRPDTVCIGDGTNDTCLPLSKLNEPCKRWPGVGSNCGEGTCISDAGVIDGALGTCLSRAALGQRCGDGFNGFGLCAQCLTCPADAGTPTCVEFGKAGWPCTADDECLNGYYFCNLTTSQCQIKPRTNEACVVDDDGDVGNCMYFDNWCRKNNAGAMAVPGTCVPYPAVGQPCGFRYDLTISCPSGAWCKGDSDAGVGSCTNYALRDQRCNVDPTADDVTQISPDCAGADDFCDVRADGGGDGLYDGICKQRAQSQGFCSDEVPCTTGLNCLPAVAPTDGGVQKCVPPKQTGAACDADDECQSEWCKADAGDTCQAKIGNGLPCNENFECQSGVCDPQSLVCVADCQPVLPNEAGGCMNYDLNSMTGYVFFSLVLVPLFRLRRKRQKR